MVPRSFLTKFKLISLSGLGFTKRHNYLNYQINYSETMGSMAISKNPHKILCKVSLQ